MFANMASDDRHPAHNAPAPPRLVVVADDLTGACDAAVAFTRVSDTVRVHLAVPDLSQPGIHALITNTRDLSPAAAASHLAVLATTLPIGHEHFKKIDSVFRGNTFTEIATSARIFPADLAILAPAYPALGRTVHQGVLRIAGPAPSSIVIEPQLRALGCNTTIIPAAEEPSTLLPLLETALLGQTRLLLCDASTQLHLDTIVHSVRSLNLRMLWIGSGGLAHALAAQHPSLSPASEPSNSSGRVLFFIGSNHAVTRGQISHLRRMTGIAASRCDQASVNSGDHLFQLSPDTSAADIAHATAHLQPQGVGCLFLTGGDTALLVCNALGITSLKLLAEFAPGVPLALAEGGRFHGVPVILKSGGFGDRTLLCHILVAFAGPEATTPRPPTPFPKLSSPSATPQA